MLMPIIMTIYNYHGDYDNGDGDDTCQQLLL